MRSINISQLYRRPVAIIGIMLLLHFQVEVDSMLCPSSCKCAFNKTMKYNYNKTTCEFDSSTVNISWSDQSQNFLQLSPMIFITCQGVNYSCAGLPIFNEIFNNTGISITRCTWIILKCIDKMYPYLEAIPIFELHDMVDIKTFDHVDLRKTVNKLSVFSRDFSAEVPDGIFNIFSGTRMVDVIGGIIKANDNMTINKNFYEDNITSSSDTLKVSNLVYLRIVNSTIDHISSAVLRGLDNLEYVMLNGNMNLQSIEPEALSNKKKLVDFYLENSSLEYLPNGMFTGLLRLKEVVIRNNLQAISLGSQAFAYLRLKTLIITNSKISILPEAIYIPTISLEQVWLDRNNMTELDLDVFHEQAVPQLSVTFNQIQRIIASSSMLRVIPDLDLSNNNISVFEDWWVNSFKMLKLNLSSNYINTIKESQLYIEDHEKIVDIDLRYNNISYIITDKSMLSNSHKSLRQNRLYLSNNPLKCDCSVTTVLKDMYLKHNLVDYEDIICTNSKEHLSDIKLYRLCNTHETLNNVIGMSAVAGLIMLIAIICIILHRNTIWLYISNLLKCKRNKLTPLETKRDAFKKFDIFISFAHQDDEFVGHVLLPKLEKDFHQTACVHYRDWTVGEFIPDQIIKSVENSRKTLVVLTKHFLMSDWSQLEFQTAHNSSKQERMSKLIIILLDEDIIGDQQLIADVKSYIVVNNYLLWGDPHFWVKLKKLLPRQGKKLKNLRKPE